MIAWASEHRLVLGQVKVEDHSNEITALPALLELIDITGAIITIDAMGTQTEMVRLIRQKKADYRPLAKVPNKGNSEVIERKN